MVIRKKFRVNGKCADSLKSQEIGSILYRNSVEQEKQIRLKGEDRKDYELVDELRKELFDTLGVESNYLSDLTYRTVMDDKCIPIFIKYIPLFQNIGISLDLISQQFYRKNNQECSDFLEKWYFHLKECGLLTDRVENTLDNAFVRIRDKSKINFYLELIKENDRFPFVMEMLGRWRIEEAKEIIINRLENDKIKTNSIRALAYYRDKATISVIEKCLDSEYVGVRQAARKAIDKLKKL